MSLKPSALWLAGAAVLLAIPGCATTENLELGENKQEFEQYSQGGNYRFQYVAEGADGYRTILWRQGESLSDDGKDSALVAGVVKSVFRERFCKDVGAPATIADGSPVPMGKEGKWMASLRCAEPPPKPKPEKKKPEKAKPKPKPETAAEEPKSETPAAAVSSGEEKPKTAAKPSSSDGPMVCEARNGGFDCKPKR